MFNNEKVFYGKHADYLIYLCKDKRQENPNGINLFETKIGLYILAPIIGLMYNRKSFIDSENSSKKSTIQLQQVKNKADELEYVYRMVMLLDDKENLSCEERLNRAFRSDHDEQLVKKNMELFDMYALGGLEVIYEFFENDLGDREELLFHLVEFMGFDSVGEH